MVLKLILGYFQLAWKVGAWNDNCNYRKTHSVWPKMVEPTVIPPGRNRNAPIPDASANRRLKRLEDSHYNVEAGRKNNPSEWC